MSLNLPNCLLGFPYYIHVILHVFLFLIFVQDHVALKIYIIMEYL